MPKKSEVIKKVLRNFISTLFRFCKDNALFLLCATYSLGCMFFTKTLSVIICSVLFLIAVYMLHEAEKLALQMSMQIPVIKVRFTYKEGENITVAEKDLNKAILYLYEVENYIEANHLKG